MAIQPLLSITITVLCVIHSYTLINNNSNIHILITQNTLKMMHNYRIQHFKCLKMSTISEEIFIKLSHFHNYSITRNSLQYTKLLPMTTKLS